MKSKADGMRVKMVNARRVLAATLITLVICCGCQIAGVIAHAIPKKVPAAYPGLAGQSVGVMVWADRGVRIDWPSLQIDLASIIQDGLRRSPAEELKGATFPVLPASIVRYQRDHPEIETMSILDVALRLGVSRLIYVEVESFATRADASVQMYRGSATFTIKLIEVENGKSVIGFEESGIRAFFPKKGPSDGVVNANDTVIYRGTVTTISQEVVNRFTTHEIE